MKDEYIRKQEAVERMVDVIINEFDVGITYAYTLAEDGLNLPPADVAPVVHAHWYILEYESLTCSRCSGFYYTGCDSTTEAKERLKEGIYPKYCPNCGAKMDGERKE